MFFKASAKTTWLFFYHLNICPVFFKNDFYGVVNLILIYQTFITGETLRWHAAETVIIF